MKKYIKLTLLASVVTIQALVASDFYSDIATTKYQERHRLPMEHPSVFKLPKNKMLSWNEKVAPFKSQEKLESQEDVETALAKLRKKYQVFMQDLAPKAREVRKQLRFSKMQFRYETAEDCKDFSYTLNGEGEWKDITIPYYHGPQGPSTAWYRCEFELDESMLGSDALFLHFNGADYYTDSYINGHHVGYHEGMLDEFEFDVRKHARKGKNIFMVKLRNDYSMLGGEGKPRRWGNKLAASNCPGWDNAHDGWSCCPAGYGLYQDIYLETRSRPYLVDIFPRPILQKDSVEVVMELQLPNGKRANRYHLSINLYGQNFKTTIVEKLRKPQSLVGGRVVSRVTIKIPKDKLRYWSPNTPWLYQIQVTLLDRDGKKVLDTMNKQFGMRSFIISTTSKPKGRMYLNGKEIRLRGTNTMGFLQLDVMRKDWGQLTDDLLLAKLTNMNFIRTTQRTVQKEVYEYADRLGIMMQADLPLFAYINHQQFPQILSQACRIERLLRSHPSVIMLTYLNESMAGKKPHAISRPAYENLFDALDIVVHQENPDRAIKYIDGDYQGPNKGLPDDHCYTTWYDGHAMQLDKLVKGAWVHVKKGWMFGCGEFGAEGLDFADLVKRRYPSKWQPKADGSWSPSMLSNYRGGSQSWEKHWVWYETQKTLEGWVTASHDHQQWGVDLMTRAFRRMPRMNTFAIHLFIDAWPNGWLKSIIDCERRAKSAWYAYRDALTPLAVQVNSDCTTFFSGQTFPVELWLCNDTNETPKCELRYQLEVDGKVIKSAKYKAEVPTIANGSCFQGFLPVTMPKVQKRTKLIIRAGLFNKKTGELIHDHALVAELFPELDIPAGKRIYLLADKNKRTYAGDIVKDLAIKNITYSGKVLTSDTIIVESYQDYDKRRAEIDAAVKAGASCLILEQPSSIRNMKVGSTQVKINGNRRTAWLVCRNQNHQWLKESKANDFKYWYDNNNNVVTRQCFRIFTGNGFTPILTHRNQNVIAEKSDGKGRWIINQFCYRDRLKYNPAGAKLLFNIIYGI